MPYEEQVIIVKKKGGHAAHHGGAKGGGAALTEQGRRIVALYRGAEARMRAAADSQYASATDLAEHLTHRREAQPRPDQGHV